MPAADDGVGVVAQFEYVALIVHMLRAQPEPAQHSMTLTASPPRGLLVLEVHVGVGLVHGLDDFVQAHHMPAVAAQRGACGGDDSLDRGDSVAFDAWDLYQ